MTAVEPRDRYQPETRLEAGLGGERWLATDRQTGKVVWLGVLDARAATDAHRSAFEAWVRIAPTLVHPSLERLLDAGETALGNPFFAVECIEAETLAQRFDREPAMSVHELVRVVTAVVDGLLVAHRAGLTHGDIAPDRVFLLTGGRARLGGFGMNRAVARSQDAAREASTLPYGDAYMSPEQAAGGAQGAADDVWSVAAILYRGVTGIAPRASVDGRSTIAGIVEGPTRAVAELRPDLPNSFVQLLEKALAADKSARFRDAAELRKALTSALILAPAVARLPVIASPVPQSGEGLGKTSPALPPPPTRARTGIGPLGRARGVEIESSALATLAPTSGANDVRRVSDAPPSLVPRESEVPSPPPSRGFTLAGSPAKPSTAAVLAPEAAAPAEDTDDSGEFLELDDEADLESVDDSDASVSDDDGVMTSATTKPARPPAPLAERKVPATPPRAAPASDPPPPPPPPAIGPNAPPAPPVPRSAATSAPGAPPSGPSGPSGSNESPERTSDARAPRVPWTMPEPPRKSGLPRRAWGAIAMLAVGSFVAFGGATRWIASKASRGATHEPGARAGTDVHAHGIATTRPPSDLGASGGAAASGALGAANLLDAGADFDAGTELDAGTLEPLPPAPIEPVPVVPQEVTPPAPHEPREPHVRPPRTGSTTTSTTGTTRVTTPAMTTPAEPPRMTTPPPVMTEPTMHALERDPGF